MGLNNFEPDKMALALIPRPFPGKYHTRVLLRWGNQSYLGKPVDAIFKHIEGEFIKKGGEPRDVDLWEFDLGGAIFIKEGGAMVMAGLAPYYFSFPNNRFVERLSHFGRYWFLRDRQLSKASGHGVYLSNMFLSSPYRPLYLDRVSDNSNGLIPGRPFPTGENLELWADTYLQPYWRRYIGDRLLPPRTVPAPVVMGGRRRTITFNAPRLDFTPPPPAPNNHASVNHYIEWLKTQTAQ